MGIHARTRYYNELRCRKTCSAANCAFSLVRLDTPAYLDILGGMCPALAIIPAPIALTLIFSPAVAVLLP